MDAYDRFIESLIAKRETDWSALAFFSLLSAAITLWRWLD